MKIKLMSLIALGLTTAAIMGQTQQWRSFSFMPPPATAQSSLTAEQDLEVVATLDDLGLTRRDTPFIPSTRGQTNNPAEGARLVFGADDRIPMLSQKYPWSAVGKVIMLSADGSTGSCTGSLIAEDVVLTNAHCVINPYNHQKAKAIRFLPNLINGRVDQDQDVGRVTAVKYGTDFRDVGSGRLSPDDWAILKLDRPLGQKYGTLRWSSIPADILAENQEKFILVGYSGDFPDANPGATAGVHQGCNIYGEANQMLLHDCDAEGGSSGGPILGLIDNQFHIVGLNMGSVSDRETNSGVNVAVMISRID